MQQITITQLETAAKILGTDVCTVHAVYTVESRGKAFYATGKPIVLFEGHVFWNELKKRGIPPAQYAERFPHLVYPNWTRAFYAPTQQNEQMRLQQAKEIHVEAALCAASYGLFQIMGFNYALCGFACVQDFVEAQSQSAYAQLLAFIRFLQTTKLYIPLQQKNWAKFARGYNGAGYLQNKYDSKLAAAYEKCTTLSI